MDTKKQENRNKKCRRSGELTHSTVTIRKTRPRTLPERLSDSESETTIERSALPSEAGKNNFVTQIFLFEPFLKARETPLCRHSLPTERDGALDSTRVLSTIGTTTNQIVQGNVKVLWRRTEMLRHRGASN